MKLKCFVQLVLLASLTLLASCSSARFASNANHMKSSEYQKRKSLKESLFNSQGNGLSEASIQKILRSKVLIKRKSRLGIIKIEQKASYTRDMGWSDPSSLMENKSFILNEKLASQFFGKIKSSGRIKDITILPSMMIPSPLTVKALRESAVRLQVDLLLVLRSENLADFEYIPFWIKDKAKTLSTVEAVLLDVRTGIIPFTAVATDTAMLRESKEDINRYALIRRSTEEAETKALSKVADSVKTFLKQAP